MKMDDRVKGSDGGRFSSGRSVLPSIDKDDISRADGQAGVVNSRPMVQLNEVQPGNSTPSSSSSGPCSMKEMRSTSVMKSLVQDALCCNSN
ncbi:hypothetical protein AKJ16_DCAP09155 [Drosera capensis]